MARRRLSMRKVKQMLRLKWEIGLSNRAIARSVKVSRETVRGYLRRAEARGYTSRDNVKEVSEAELESRLFSSNKKQPDTSKRVPDWREIHQELSRKGVTLRLLWQEYMEECPKTAYKYSQFCNLYNQWESKLPSVMVQTYKGGQYLFVDYAGQTVPWTDPVTGAVFQHTRDQRGDAAPSDAEMIK